MYLVIQDIIAIKIVNTPEQIKKILAMNLHQYLLNSYNGKIDISINFLNTINHSGILYPISSIGCYDEINYYIIDRKRNKMELPFEYIGKPFSINILCSSLL